MKCQTYLAMMMMMIKIEMVMIGSHRVKKNTTIKFKEKLIWGLFLFKLLKKFKFLYLKLKT